MKDGQKTSINRQGVENATSKREKSENKSRIF